MAKEKGRLREFADRAKQNERGMWGVIDNEVDSMVDRRQKARLAIIIAVTCFICAAAMLFSLFLKG